MLRVLFFLILIAVLGWGFGWLADRPGDLVFTFAGMRYHVTMMVAVSILVAIIAAVMLVWWLVKSMIRSPYTLKRHFRARTRDRGYQALSTGLLAAGAGDAQAAQRMRLQASKLLNADQEPLLHLLDVQTAMLEGRTDDVRRHFEAMIADPETKLLGLRGLYLEAIRANAREAASHFAEEAVAIAPQLEWASNAVLGQKSLEGDWQGALQVLDARQATLNLGKQSKLVREKIARDRAALLAAEAMDLFDRDPVQARSCAQKAYKLAPDLTPVAVILARCMLRDGDIRKGCKVLEAAWRQQPHPEIAEVYLHARAGDSALDRLKKAQHLVSLRDRDVEAKLVLAQAALEAGELQLARESAEKALQQEPREQAFLLMADIEEAQYGNQANNQGRIREWLARAVKAPRDPVWTADGVVMDHWSPVSPVTGRINAFEWKAPVEQIGNVIENDVTSLDAPLPEPVISKNPSDIEDVIHEIQIDTGSKKNVPVADLIPKQMPATASGEKHRVVDDPGVSASETEIKKQSPLRLF